MMNSALKPIIRTVALIVIPALLLSDPSLAELAANDHHAVIPYYISELLDQEKDTLLAFVRHGQPVNGRTAQDRVQDFKDEWDIMTAKALARKYVTKAQRLNGKVSLEDVEAELVRQINELARRHDALNERCAALIAGIREEFERARAGRLTDARGSTSGANLTSLARRRVAIEHTTFVKMDPPQLPQVVDWMITEQCNRTCATCWVSDVGVPGPSIGLEEHKAMIDALWDKGVRSIAFTGGEPLLIPHLGELLAYAKRIGGHELQINLYTNGTLLEERFDEIMPFVDFLSLSLDASSREENARLRGGEEADFDRVFRVIERLKDSDRRPRLQIVTQVHGKNIDALSRIGALLKEKVGAVQDFRWKLNYYIPIGRHPAPDAGFEIPYEEFERRAKETQEEFSPLSVPYSPAMHDYRCLMIGQEGDLITAAVGAYLLIGNLRTGLFREDAHKIFEKIIDTKITETAHLRRGDVHAKLKPLESDGTAPGSRASPPGTATEGETGGRQSSTGLPPETQQGDQDIRHSTSGSEYAAEIVDQMKSCIERPDESALFHEYATYVAENFPENDLLKAALTIFFVRYGNIAVDLEGLEDREAAEYWAMDYLKKFFDAHGLFFTRNLTNVAETVLFGIPDSCIRVNRLGLERIVFVRIDRAWTRVFGGRWRDGSTIHGSTTFGEPDVYVFFNIDQQRTIEEAMWTVLEETVHKFDDTTLAQRFPDQDERADAMEYTAPLHILSLARDERTIRSEVEELLAVGSPDTHAHQEIIDFLSRDTSAVQDRNVSAAAKVYHTAIEPVLSERGIDPNEFLVSIRDPSARIDPGILEAMRQRAADALRVFYEQTIGEIPEYPDVTALPIEKIDTGGLRHSTSGTEDSSSLSDYTITADTVRFMLEDGLISREEFDAIVADERFTRLGSALYFVDIFRMQYFEGKEERQILEWARRAGILLSTISSTTKTRWLELMATHPVIARKMNIVAQCVQYVPEAHDLRRVVECRYGIGEGKGPMPVREMARALGATGPYVDARLRPMRPYVRALASGDTQSARTILSDYTRGLHTGKGWSEHEVMAVRTEATTITGALPEDGWVEKRFPPVSLTVKTPEEPILEVPKREGPKKRKRPDVAREEPRPAPEPPAEPISRDVAPVQRPSAEPPKEEKPKEEPVPKREEKPAVPVVKETPPPPVMPEPAQVTLPPVENLSEQDIRRAAGLLTMGQEPGALCLEISRGAWVFAAMLNVLPGIAKGRVLKGAKIFELGGTGYPSLREYLRTVTQSDRVYNIDQRTEKATNVRVPTLPKYYADILPDVARMPDANKPELIFSIGGVSSGFESENFEEDWRLICNSLREGGRIVVRPFMQEEAFDKDSQALGRFAEALRRNNVQIERIFIIPYPGIRDVRIFVLRKAEGNAGPAATRGSTSGTDDVDYPAGRQAEILSNRSTADIRASILKTPGLRDDLGDEKLRSAVDELLSWNTDYGAKFNFDYQRETIAADLISIINERKDRDKTFTLYALGLGGSPAELILFTKMLERALRRCGEDPAAWTIHIYAVDATADFEDSAARTFHYPNLTYVFSNILDEEGLRDLCGELPKADYVLFRHVFYVTDVAKREGFKVNYDDPRGIISPLRIYVACRMIFGAMAKPGTRLVLESPYDNHVGASDRRFLPPGCRELGREKGIVLIDDPQALLGLNSFRRFNEIIDENSFRRTAADVYEPPAVDDARPKRFSSSGGSMEDGDSSGRQQGRQPPAGTTGAGRPLRGQSPSGTATHGDARERQSTSGSQDGTEAEQETRAISGPVDREIISMSRNFVEQHMDEVLALVNAVPGSHWDRDKLLGIYPEDTKYCLAVTDKKTGRIISILIAYEQGPQDELNISCDHIFIRRLCTVEDSRGRRYATRLLQGLAEEADRSGQENIALQTDAENIPSNGLYNNLGFTNVATITAGDHRDNVYLISSRALSVSTRNKIEEKQESDADGAARPSSSGVVAEPGEVSRISPQSVIDDVSDLMRQLSAHMLLDLDGQIDLADIAVVMKKDLARDTAGEKEIVLAETLRQRYRVMKQDLEKLIGKDVVEVSSREEMVGAAEELISKGLKVIILDDGTLSKGLGANDIARGKPGEDYCVVAAPYEEREEKTVQFVNLNAMTLMGAGILYNRTSLFTLAYRIFRGEDAPEELVRRLEEKTLWLISVLPRIVKFDGDALKDRADLMKLFSVAA